MLFFKHKSHELLTKVELLTKNVFVFSERAMSWRERAQQALDSKDVVESLAKLKEHQAKAEAKKQSKKKPSDSSTEGSESDAGGNGGGSSDEELEGVKPDTKQDKHNRSGH